MIGCNMSSDMDDGYPNYPEIDTSTNADLLKSNLFPAINNNQVREMQLINEDLMCQLATTCDRMNTWAREQGVEECQDPYKDYALRDLADRLWSRTSEKYFALRDTIYNLNERTS